LERPVPSLDFPERSSVGCPMKVEAATAPAGASALTAVLLIALGSLQPVANFALANLINEDVDLGRVLVYFIGLVLVGSGLCFGATALSGKHHRVRVAAVLGVLILLLFNEYLWFPQARSLVAWSGLPYRATYLCEAALLVSAVALVWRFAKTQDFVRVLTVFLAVFGSWDAVRAVSYAVTASGGPEVVQLRARAGASRLSPASTSGTPRNVYFVLPDSHVGEEVFPFLEVRPALFEGLRNLGFHVVPGARTNATVTTYSMAHLMSMELLFEDRERVTPAFSNALPDMAATAVVKEFRRRGYAYVHASDGYDGPACPEEADRCVAAKGFFTKQDVQFLERSPLVRVGKQIYVPGSQFPVVILVYPNRMEVPELMERLPDPSSGPYFYFVHLSLPHPPYRFNAKCEYDGRLEYGLAAYKEQVQCTATLLESFAKRMKERDPNSIVILQSDTGDVFDVGNEGPKVLGWPVAAMGRRISILSAFYGPGSCTSQLKPGLSPVNTFRWVFACLDGRRPDYVADKTWVVRYLADVPTGDIVPWPVD
jgi:hypothetical protein